MGRPKKGNTKRLAFSAKLTPSAKNRLEALSFVTKESAYVLLEKAFWVYWDTLPEAERKKAETIASTREDDTPP